VKFYSNVTTESGPELHCNEIIYSVLHPHAGWWPAGFDGVPRNIAGLSWANRCWRDRWRTTGFPTLHRLVCDMAVRLPMVMTIRAIQTIVTQPSSFAPTLVMSAFADTEKLLSSTQTIRRLWLRDIKSTIKLALASSRLQPTKPSSPT